MIVYGDPQFQATLAEALGWLWKRMSSVEMVALDELRAWLIQAGQIEQAVADARELSGSTEAIGRCEALTDALADAFIPCLEKPETLACPVSVLARVQPHVLKAQRLSLAQEPLTFKVPEGFEFYALFPEQYCQTALAWVSAHNQSRTRDARVIGIRGIGTTLSAVVAAVFRRARWNVTRLTVRPVGPPFARTVPPFEREDAGVEAIVVDEGPGLSGSSMASVARALLDSGFEPERISFFPGHDGRPGPAASEQVRACWSLIRSYSTRLEEVRWSGRDLWQGLQATTQQLFGNGDLPGRLDDLAGGRWRRFAYDGEGDWPAVCARFERSKYLCTTRSGRRVLWKFTGLGAWIGPEETALLGGAERKLSAQNCTIAPLAISCGFAALPWAVGRRLTRADAQQPGMIKRLGEYILRAGRPPLNAAEAQTARERLEQMIYQNLEEAFGKVEALSARALLSPLPIGCVPVAFGDGHLAPHEWVETPDGRLLKTDNTGHWTDHTVVGRQSILWDIAGACVEWELDRAGRHLLFKLAEQEYLEIDPIALRFYELAYACFRLGQITLCRDLESGDSPEGARLSSACAYYRSCILGLLHRARSPA
jgi:hypothetical protein